MVEPAASTSGEKPSRVQSSPNGTSQRDVDPTLEQEGAPFPVALAALAILAVWFGRGIAHALPGTLAGIDAQISQVELLAAYLTQLCALSFAVLSVRMMLRTLTSSTSPMLKALSATAVLTSVSVAYFSSGATYQLATTWLSAVATTCGFLGIATGLSVLHRAELRGAGLILLLATSSALLHFVARVVALISSSDPDASWYFTARCITTVGFVVELVAITSALVWVRPGKTPFASQLVGAIAVAVASSLAWAAQGATAGWRLVLERTLSSLVSHPDPIVPASLRHFGELLALISCCLCLLPFHRVRQMRLIVVLAILSRASLDVPLGGLLGVGSALCLITLARNTTLAPIIPLNR